MKAANRIGTRWREWQTCVFRFVNGLPLVVIELKKPGVPARAAFDKNLTHYKAEIPQLFWLNALLIASNGTDSCLRSLKVYHLGSNYRASKCTTPGDKPEGGNVPVLPESSPPSWRMYSRCNNNNQSSL